MNQTYCLTGGDGEVHASSHRDGLHGDGRVCHAVAVLDPDNPVVVERLHTLWCEAIVSKGTSSRQVDSMQAALREFANPTPPIIEPTGLGAVVEGSDGRHWVRIDRDGGAAKWLLVNAPADTDPRYVWSAVNAVRVLSEGVPA